MDSYDNSPTSEFKPVRAPEPQVGTETAQDTTPPSYDELREAVVKLTGDNRVLREDNHELALNIKGEDRARRRMWIATALCVAFALSAVGLGAWAIKENIARKDALSQVATVDTSQRQSVQKVSDLQRNLDSVTGERDSLKKDLDRVKNDFTSTKQKLQGENTRLANDNTQLRSQNQELKDKADSAVSNRDTLTSQVDNLQRRVHELQTKNDEAENYISQLEDYADKLEAKTNPE